MTKGSKFCEYLMLIEGHPIDCTCTAASVPSLRMNVASPRISAPCKEPMPRSACMTGMAIAKI